MVGPIRIYELEFPMLKDLVSKQQLFHYNLDTEHNQRFLEIGIKEFTDYMTKESDYICFAMFDHDEPVGFVACTVSEDNTAFIEDIFVDTEARNLGAGHLLMSRLIKELESKSVIDIKVHVTKNNESVFGFYEKFGFTFDSHDDTGHILVRRQSTSDSVVYKDIKTIDTLKLVELFESVGWITDSAAYPERLTSAIQRSSTVFSAWEGDRLVGLVSAIDDGMHVYIVYLLVNPNYQNKGIGRVLLGNMINRYGNYKIILTTEEKNKSYYEDFGFEVDSIGMIKVGLGNKCEAAIDNDGYSGTFKSLKRMINLYNI